MSFTWLQKIILRRLLNKESPERYTTSASEEEQMNYDYMYVLGSTKEHKDSMLLSWDETNDNFTYMWWPEDAHAQSGTEASCSSADVIWSTLNVRHRYRTWDIKYSTASEAFVHDLFHLPLIRWRYQKFRNIFLRPVKPDHRMGLLNTIVEMHDKQEPITTHELLAHIHGSAIRLSGEYYPLQKNLQFLLDSLKDTGDLLYKDEDDPIHFFGHGTIAPTPKSLATIALFNEDVRRHKDMVRMSRRQLLLGWGMFALAAVTLFVELGKTFELWK